MNGLDILDNDDLAIFIGNLQLRELARIKTVRRLLARVEQLEIEARLEPTDLADQPDLVRVDGVKP